MSKVPNIAPVVQQPEEKHASLERQLCAVVTMAACEAPSDEVISTQLDQLVDMIGAAHTLLQRCDLPSTTTQALKKLLGEARAASSVARDRHLDDSRYRLERATLAWKGSGLMLRREHDGAIVDLPDPRILIKSRVAAASDAMPARKQAARASR